jgi:hypothetical protein
MLAKPALRIAGDRDSIDDGMRPLPPPGQFIGNRLALPSSAAPSDHMMRGKLRCELVGRLLSRRAGTRRWGSVTATAGWAMTKVTSGVLEHDREARRAFQVGTLRASCLSNGGQVLMIDNDIATLKHRAGRDDEPTLPLLAAVGFAAKFLPHHLLDPAIRRHSAPACRAVGQRPARGVPVEERSCQTAARCIVGRSAIFFIAGLRPAPASAWPAPAQRGDTSPVVSAQ